MADKLDLENEKREKLGQEMLKNLFEILTLDDRTIRNMVLKEDGVFHENKILGLDDSLYK